MYDLKKLYPVDVTDLVRVGRNMDGGYVLSQKQLTNTQILLSFGINEDWSFEEDFSEKSSNDIQIYAYDSSISPKIFFKRSKDHLALTIRYLLALNFEQAYIHAGRWKNLPRIARRFTKFFNTTQNYVFIPKYLGVVDNDEFSRFDTILQYFNHKNDLSIFVKMDIENWEYRTLSQILPFSQKINGLAIEFHELDILGDKFQEIVKLLSKDFAIIHVHANNFGDFIPNTNLPLALEITFMNKILLNDNVLHTQKKYPLKELDYPCNPTKPDIELIFV